MPAVDQSDVVVTALNLLALNQGGDHGPHVSPSWVVIFVIPFFSWGYFARFARGLARDLRQQDFIHAARIMGALMADVMP